MIQPTDAMIFRGSRGCATSYCGKGCLSGARNPHVVLCRPLKPLIMIPNFPNFSYTQPKFCLKLFVDQSMWKSSHLFKEYKSLCPSEINESISSSMYPLPEF